MRPLLHKALSLAVSKGGTATIDQNGHHAKISVNVGIEQLGSGGSSYTFDPSVALLLTGDIYC
jgi:hypothetical protein